MKKNALKEVVISVCDICGRDSNKCLIHKCKVCGRDVCCACYSSLMIADEYITCCKNCEKVGDSYKKRLRELGERYDGSRRKIIDEWKKEASMDR